MRRILATASGYRCFQNIVAAAAGRRRLVDEYIRPRPGNRVLDLGCGDGGLVAELGEVDYVGIDISDAYIGSARNQFGDRATFFAGDFEQEQALAHGPFDLVLAQGVLHHLDDDDARRLMSYAAKAMQPTGGRLVTIDPCRTTGQGWVERLLIAADRGEYIRQAGDYRALAETVFGSVQESLVADLTRIRYTVNIVESTSPRAR